MDLNAWIYGYGRILHEVFRKVSLMDVSVMNPFTKVDFDPFWPTKLGLRVYLKIFGEESSFETVDSPSRLLELSSLIIEAVAKSFKWKGTTVKEYRRSLDEIDKLIFSLNSLKGNLKKDMDDQIKHLNEVDLEELIYE
ncbi:MAG: hypothetical protein DRG59_11585 [Deltaproteobacteria bacterium]|nr:MAG: hypothetical protein DRG59_11585 [Deltaproteobacteria bacterium]